MTPELLLWAAYAMVVVAWANQHRRAVFVGLSVAAIATALTSSVLAAWAAS